MADVQQAMNAQNFVRLSQRHGNGNMFCPSQYFAHSVLDYANFSPLMPMIWEAYRGFT